MTFNYHSPGVDSSLYGYDESRSTGDGLSVSAYGPNGYVWVPYQDLPKLFEGMLAGPADGDDGEPAETAQDRAERLAAMTADPGGGNEALLTLAAALIRRHLETSDYDTWPAGYREAVAAIARELAAAAIQFAAELVPPGPGV